MIQISDDYLTYKRFKRVAGRLLGLDGPAVVSLERFISSPTNFHIKVFDGKAGSDLDSLCIVVKAIIAKKLIVEDNLRLWPVRKRDFVVITSAVIVFPHNAHCVCVIVGDCPVYGL